ncbi:MAG: hypothetical protein LAO79_06760 [Acidobacteriia bacterium]|nr:hypothetical protein [Terriglobia bacterium]
MMKKMMLLISVVSLAVASAASSFRVDLYQPTVINGTTLKAGEAKVELQDGKAVLKQGKTSVEVTVKVETNKEKYHYTTIGYKDGSEHQIKDICVGGTTTHIWFE